MNPNTLSNTPPNYQQQRGFTEAPNLNNEAFAGTGTTGTHIHSLVDAPIIRDVWEDNFEQEFKLIMNLAEKYRVIAMDTEFPGIVYRLNENDLESISNYHEIEYRTIKMNVDKLKVIQVGISIADEDGFMPPGIGTWQFNFKFDLHNDLYLKESIEMLSEAGIKFEQHAVKGIDPQLFSEYLIASGLVLNEDIKWISFHGGFDFAYLVRMLCGTDLPDDDSGFSAFLNIYFPCFFDIKFMTKEIESLKSGSLSKIAAELRVRRIGPQHQAGSDALLTLSTYFKLRTTYFKGVPDSKHSNVLYGIGPHGNEGLSDYVWQNFIVSEYPYMMYNSYNVGQMNQMNPMMNNNYYSQNDGMYGGMGGMSSMNNMSGMSGMSGMSSMSSNQYNMSYNNYGSYGGSSQYMEAPSNKPKKFGK